MVFLVLAGLALSPLAAAAQDAAAVAEAAPSADTDAPASEEPPVDPAVIAALAADVEALAATTPPPPPVVTVPRLTPVVIELLATLSSETSTAGDHFPIRLYEPVQIDGQTVIPAGTMGEGEVIHAKHKGGMGAAGELILTARFLEIYGQRIPLRSLRINGDGQSRIDTVNTINVASAATIPLASLVGFFITGGAKTVNEGTVAGARFAEDFEVLAPDAAPAPPENEPAAAPEATVPVPQEASEGSQLEGPRE